MANQSTTADETVDAATAGRAEDRNVEAGDLNSSQPDPPPDNEANGSAGPAAPADQGQGLDGTMQSLRAELDAERAKSTEYLAQWQRTAADFSNYKRRGEQERAELAKLFNVSLVTNILPVLDNFERALASVPEQIKDESWVSGVSLTEKQLRAALEKEGLRAIEAMGQKFNPNLHEAVANEPSDEHEDDTVIGEFQKGYKLHDRVIRPSIVKVSKRS
ncbi:MAG: nucleotide exchange factor GrpE [Chloroflexota bacterium]